MINRYKNLGNLIYLNTDETKELTKRFRGFIIGEIKKENTITDKMILNGLTLIVKSIREREKKQKPKSIIKSAKIKNICAIQHFSKILELIDNGIGAKAITSYLKKNMHCEKISHATIQKIINYVRENDG